MELWTKLILIFTNVWQRLPTFCQRLVRFRLVKFCQLGKQASAAHRIPAGVVGVAARLKCSTWSRLSTRSCCATSVARQRWKSFFLSLAHDGSTDGNERIVIAAIFGCAPVKITNVAQSYKILNRYTSAHAESRCKFVNGMKAMKITIDILLRVLKTNANS